MAPSPPTGTRHHPDLVTTLPWGHNAPHPAPNVPRPCTPSDVSPSHVPPPSHPTFLTPYPNPPAAPPVPFSPPFYPPVGRSSPSSWSSAGWGSAAGAGRQQRDRVSGVGVATGPPPRQGFAGQQRRAVPEPPPYRLAGDVPAQGPRREVHEGGGVGHEFGQGEQHHGLVRLGQPHGFG